ncbi:MAG: RdgB/HAM1 family non-canonical purine NTP pyrophosphatase [Victivallales bacterium]|nr:RdgB/HAM1 family non-canonical purine NTP pyrophosphatase [Victivallales bacterium]
MAQIVAATNNLKKLTELRKMLADQEVEIIGLDRYKNYPEVEETGATFEENASQKALAANRYTDLPAFADDSGLCVEALGDEPGIHSARYAENDAARIAKLLAALQGQDNRRAKFVCVIAIAFNGEIIETFRGEVHGVITDVPRGSNGFGYDPIFMPDGYDRTFGELTAEVKDKISHRARAVKAAVDFVEDEMSSCFDDFGC